MGACSSLIVPQLAIEERLSVQNTRQVRGGPVTVAFCEVRKNTVLTVSVVARREDSTPLIPYPSFYTILRWFHPLPDPHNISLLGLSQKVSLLGPEAKCVSSLHAFLLVTCLTHCVLLGFTVLATLGGP
jgi:hypothetical protein